MLAKEMTRLGRNVLIYGGGDALVRFISFLLLPLFTRYLTPDDYGVRGLLLALAAVLSPVFSLGLSAAVGPCYFEGNNLQRKAATVWTACGLLVASAVVMLIVGTLYSSAICRLAFQSDKYAGLLRLTLWTTALTILSEPFNLYLRFEEKARLVVVISVTSALVTIGASFLLVVVFRRGVLGLVLAALVGRVAMLAMQVGPALAGLPIRWTRSLVRPLLILGIPLIPSFVWLYIIQQAGKYMLQWRWGLDAVGLYQIGLSVSAFAGLAVVAFQSAWYPFFMSFMDRPAEAGPVFSRTLTFYVFATCLMTVCFFAFAKPVMTVMTQPAFHPAYRVVGFSAAGLFLQGIFWVLMPPMYFAREVQAQALIQGIA
ncbi:MAG: lipopolysaccharide biosynthesis protein, partial [Verrucomicrobia bacterium]|nr:lipopolysaccharide biosynthesis protein [Verrucomicrobiota bacterium]